MAGQWTLDVGDFPIETPMNPVDFPATFDDTEEIRPKSPRFRLLPGHQCYASRPGEI